MVALLSYPFDVPRPGFVPENPNATRPDHLHTPLTTEAIRTGHHCVIEKPLCLKIEEAKRVRDLARQASLYVYTDYHKRYDRDIRKAAWK